MRIPRPALTLHGILIPCQVDRLLCELQVDALQLGVPCHAHDELKNIQDELWTMLRRKSMQDLFGKDAE